MTHTRREMLFRRSDYQRGSVEGKSVVHLRELAGLDSLPGDGQGCPRADLPVPPRVVVCVYSSLGELPPADPFHKDTLSDQQWAILDTRTCLAMAAGVDPAAIARASPRPHERVANEKPDVLHEVCLPDPTFFPSFQDETALNVAHVPFTEYVIDWLAATGHIVFFGGGEVFAYPTTASPTHVHAHTNCSYEQYDEWGPLRRWSEDVSQAIGDVQIGWNRSWPDSAHLTATFKSLNPNRTRLISPGTFARQDARLSSPYFTAAYMLFVERTIARNVDNVVHRPKFGAVEIRIYSFSELYRHEFCECRGFASAEFVPYDPFGHIEAMGRSGVASQRDIRNLRRAWNATEVIDEPPVPPSFDEEQKTAELSDLWATFGHANECWEDSVRALGPHPEAARFQQEFNKSVLCTHE